MLSHGGSGAFVGGTVVVLVIGVLLCVKKKKAKSGGAPPDLVKASHGQSPMTSSDTFDMLRNPLREDRGDTVGAQWSVRRKGPQPKRDPTSQESVDSFEAYGSYVHPSVPSSRSAASYLALRCLIRTITLTEGYQIRLASAQTFLTHTYHRTSQQG